MKLQIATDIANTETVFSIADAVHDVIDILEVGTPVITKEGLVPVYLSLIHIFIDQCH